MMKRLIGYDGSSCADAALADLNLAGLPQKAEVVVISLADVFLPPQQLEDEITNTIFHGNTPIAVLNARKRAYTAVQEAEKLAEKAKNIIKATFPEWEVKAEADGDSPAWGIIKRAIDWK